MSDAISTYMTADHRHCDHYLANFEQAVDRGEWDAAGTAGQDLSESLLRHFAREEEKLFPDLMALDPRARGPVQVMTMEHRQMRALLDELREALGGRDAKACLGLVETLHFLIQQHNAKEEGILYPLADQGLATQAEELVAELKAF